MTDGLNLDDLSDFADELAAVARQTPKKAKQFLRKEGSKLARKTKARAKREVGTAHKKPKKYAGSPHYVNTIKRGKVYTYRGANVIAVRAYSAAPHAHFIEYGHPHMTHGKRAGDVSERPIFGKTEQEFARQYAADAEKFLDDALGALDT